VGVFSKWIASLLHTDPRLLALSLATFAIRLWGLVCLATAGAWDSRHDC
jgi:hypothetical protein